MQSADRPIGIFDSGIGGLTIARKIIEDFPGEDIIYLGDTAHLPYGDKSPALVRYFVTKITEWLLKQHCKLVVIACNSASSIAYNDMVEIFGGRTHFINVVDPIVQGISDNENFNRVGIIGTKATIGSGVYQKLLSESRPELQVQALATPLLAPMIEEGFFHDNISQEVIKSYLGDNRFKGIDVMALACTHYPLIKKDIEQFYSGTISVYDSTDFTSEMVRRYLSAHNLLNRGMAGSAKFYATDLTASFQATTKIFFGETVTLELCDLWDS